VFILGAGYKESNIMNWGKCPVEKGEDSNQGWGKKKRITKGTEGSNGGE